MLDTLVPQRYRALMFAPACDRLSVCGRSARSLQLLILKDLEEEAGDSGRTGARYGLSAPAFDRFMALLNHEEQLTRLRCSALALLTIQEALRLTMVENHPAPVIAVLEAAHRGLRSTYAPVPLDRQARAEMQLQTAKHLGQGIEYLRLSRESRWPLGRRS